MPPHFLYLFISRLKEPQGWVGSGKPTLSSQREKTSRLRRQKQWKVLMWERQSNQYTLILQSLPAPTAQTEPSLVKTSIPPLCSRPFRQLRRAPEQNRHNPSYTKGQALWKGENETEKLKADSHHWNKNSLICTEIWATGHKQLKTCFPSLKEMKPLLLGSGPQAVKPAPGWNAGKWGYKWLVWS